MVYISFAANAQLVPNYISVQARSLPQGRWLVGYNQFKTPVGSNFDSYGKYDAFSEQKKMHLKAQTLIQDDPLRGPALEGLLSSYNVQSSTVLGTYDIYLKGDIAADIFTIGYGISDTLGIYITAPYLKWDMQTAFVFKKSEKMIQLLNQLKQDGQAQAAVDLETGVSAGVVNALQKNGLSSESLNSKSQALGDIQINLKWAKDCQEDLCTSIDPFIILPTANKMNSNTILPIKSGDRRWAVGLGSSSLWSFSKMSSGLSFNIQYPLPGKTEARPPLNTLSTQQSSLFTYDDNVSVKNGLKLNLHADQSLILYKTISFNLGLDYQKKWATEYSGDLLSSDDYAKISDESEQELTTFIAGLSLNSLDLFLKNKFVIPMQVGLSGQWPLAGINTSADFSVAGNIYFFF